ncbi:MAG TPA: hypothetical protein VNT20_21110 [Flavisolibacter sp.]|jgi:hypothetical protein|nr:hypothetical protein [Flavisolibacter sp.]
MNARKEEFLKNRLIPLLKQIPSDTPPRWGKMTLQQTIEHFSDSVRIASGKTVYTDFVFGPEQLQKNRDFMLSEKPFKENTVNPLMPEVPAPVINISAEAALTELQKELDYFFSVFEENNLQVTRSPFFGDLNYEQNVHLLHKHALHHLRQFGVSIS